MEYKKMLRALSDVEEQRNISEAVILEALNEAVAKHIKKMLNFRILMLLLNSMKRKRSLIFIRTT